MSSVFIKILIIVSAVAGLSLLPADLPSTYPVEAIAATKGKQHTTVTVTPSEPAASRTYRVVLLCDTQESRTKGLQGFRPLAKDEAALFVFEKPVPVTFWMGSVSFPIDIIFVGPDKRVITVYEHCRPGSRDLYPSVKKAKWVIETATGSGIRAGDRVGFK